MAVECYSIEWDPPSKGGPCYAVYRYLLVDGLRPRWVRVERLTSCPYYDIACLYVKARHGISQKFVVYSGDSRITLYQIRTLFPETKTMPLKIALDYVRDRI